jgi:hypothetical protein
MAEKTYVERSSLGLRIFSFEGCWLTISGRWGFQPIKTRIDLRRARPDLREASVRLNRALVVSFVVAMAPVVAVIATPERVLRSRIDGAFLELFALGWMALCLWQGWRYFPRIEFVRVRSKRGGVLLDIVKDRNAPADYAAFLEELRTRIESCAIS